LDVTAQHLASTSGASRRAKGAKLVLSLMASPLWLFGWVAGLGAFAFQAAALNKGQLSIVQALLVTELIFGLVLRRVWLHQAIRRVAWGSAVLTCAGLAAFVLIDQPQGGTPKPDAHAWAAVLAVLGGMAAAMALAAQRGSPRRRAALYATAAAIVWALVATFIKTVSVTLTDSGLGAVFTHWPAYAMALGGVTGLVLVQAALHVGPLSVSQPLLVIVDPVVSIGLSVWLFQERYTGGPVAVAGSFVAFAAMSAGVVVLTRTAPATMTARPRG
jgi:drug/metabolite transporter (DMT)-like permease